MVRKGSRVQLSSTAPNIMSEITTKVEVAGLGIAAVGAGIELIARRAALGAEILGAGIGLFVLGAIAETIHANRNKKPDKHSW